MKYEVKKFLKKEFKIEKLLLNIKFMFLPGIRCSSDLYTYPGLFILTF